MYSLFTTDEIKPSGWLRRQLEIQAKGLSGNLDLVWPDVRDSAWIGGSAEGWERVPYWLDGFVPLAYLLDDEDMKARAKKYIDAIIAGQKEDGWICPCTDEERPTYDSWAVQLISKTLTVYYECSKDERIPDVIYRLLKNYYEMLRDGTIALFKWGKYRWFETFIAINFTYGRTGEEWLKDLAHILRGQGADYSAFLPLWKRSLNKWTFETHIVNLGMCLKAEAVSHGLLGEEYSGYAETIGECLKEYNGTPVGLFTGDECIGGLSPIHGTELCAVVEQMFSYELLFADTGDAKWAEMLEKIAFNALPATFSDDMWAHQYDQLSNQMNCSVFPGKPVFTTNGREAHIFGLEPNYGCCTANLSQGWPKFALSAFYAGENEIVSAIPMPAVLSCGTCDIETVTDYPFENSVKYIIKAKKDFVFKARIPSFAENVKIGCGRIENGFLCVGFAAGEEKTVTLSFGTVPHFVDRPYGLKTAECGSLVFSLPVEYEAKMREFEKNGVERKFPYCDYEYVPVSDWAFGYADSSLTVEYNGVPEVPFDSHKPAVTLTARVAPIDWGEEDGYENFCAKLPRSTEPTGDARETELYPYGCAKLRMTELPFVGDIADKR